MDEQLRRAALEGNTESLLQIHRQNPLLLDRATVMGCFDETPLHAAALLGHLDFANQILNLKPDLAESLDSGRSSPLHLASAKGHVGIVRALVSARPKMCLVSDRDGLNPVHVAARKGRVEVLRFLVRASPEAARARVDQGGTVLHLCVKQCEMEGLKVLMEEIGDWGFVNAKDVYGCTILHLAVADKQLQILKYLLTSGKIDVNAKNTNGYTALDILAQSRRDVQDWDIGNALLEAGASKSTAIIPSSGNENGAVRPVQTMPSATPENGPRSPIVVHDRCSTPSVPNGINLQMPSDRCSTPSVPNEINPQMPSFLRNDTMPFEAQRDGPSQKNLNQGEWLSKKRDALMVVASLLAAMAFQAGVNPPGGVWQDNSPPDSLGNPVPNAHRAGEAVVAYNYPQTYKYYLRANTISFVASLSTILLLISGLPFRRRTFMWILMVIMWLSITSMAFTYSYSIVAVTPKKDREPLRHIMYVAVPVWCGVMGLLLLGHTIRLVGRLLKGNKLSPVRAAANHA